MAHCCGVDSYGSVSFISVFNVRVRSIIVISSSIKPKGAKIVLTRGIWSLRLYRFFIFIFLLPENCPLVNEKLNFKFLLNVFRASFSRDQCFTLIIPSRFWNLIIAISSTNRKWEFMFLSSSFTIKKFHEPTDSSRMKPNEFLESNHVLKWNARHKEFYLKAYEIPFSLVKQLKMFIFMSKMLLYGDICKVSNVMCARCPTAVNYIKWPLSVLTFMFSSPLKATQ